MLQAINISKHYKSAPVLKDASFVLSSGQCLGIAGHNGSGKSTLLSIVAQVVLADSGQMQCDGKNILNDRAFLRNQLGYIPQNPALLEDLTVKENLLYWQQVYGIKSTPLDENSSLAFLQLQGFEKKKVSKLSGGMRQRVNIALGLLNNPRYLLMDEPFSALDINYRSSFMQYLLDYKKRNGAILLCSHELQEIEELCDHLLILQNGKICFYGEAAQALQNQEQLKRWLSPQ